MNASQVDRSSVVRVCMGDWHVANCDHVLPGLQVGIERSRNTATVRHPEFAVQVWRSPPHSL